MSESCLLKPDRQFVDQILATGGDDLKKCYQCATCSVVCELSPDERPFPRKEMIWAQWGLKDRLVADPDVWLCHQCNDCSVHCPRGARPADVLAALRRQAVEHFAVPRLLGRWVNRSEGLLSLLLVVPAVLLTLALLVQYQYRLEEFGPLSGILGFMNHEGFYASLFPHWLLIGFYSTFWGLSMLGALVGVVRFWRGMKAADKAAGRYSPKVGIVPSVVRTVTSIFRHDKFSKCTSRASRRLAHLGAFYGFAALFLVSVWAVVALYMINPFIEHELHYPFALWNPWKILANLGAVVLIAGCVMAIRDRLGDEKEVGASTSFDWVFVWLLLGVGVTGLLTEVLRFPGEPALAEASAWAPVAYTAYGVYFVHLILVFDLLVYLPYSKFAHLVYRTVALVYAEHTGRSTGMGEKA
jgi:quinone-modifying oxidoreductase subunit QmoC